MLDEEDNKIFIILIIIIYCNLSIMKKCYYIWGFFGNYWDIYLLEIIRLVYVSW